MTTAYIEKRVPSSDGIHTLVGRAYLPEGEVIGLFHVVHGMTEHIARYDRFMREMAEAGYICFGYDHLGHGHTAAEGEHGFIAHRDGWDHLCRDVALFADAMKAEYGRELPYILMGHSMGSFIVRVAVTRYVHPTRLIVMGTGGPNPAAGVGLAVISIIKKIKGERHISDLVQKLAFGTYNKRFADESDPRSWLTTNEEIREIYSADRLCAFRFTVSAMGDLIRLNKMSGEKRCYTATPKDMPVLLVSGTDDPVGDYGKGVRAVYKGLTSSGVEAELRLYDGARHEILNDICRDEVIADILQFVEK